MTRKPSCSLTFTALENSFVSCQGKEAVKQPCPVAIPISKDNYLMQDMYKGVIIPFTCWWLPAAFLTGVKDHLTGVKHDMHGTGNLTNSPKLVRSCTLKRIYY